MYRMYSATTWRNVLLEKGDNWLESVKLTYCYSFFTMLFLDNDPHTVAPLKIFVKLKLGETETIDKTQALKKHQN